MDNIVYGAIAVGVVAVLIYTRNRKIDREVADEIGQEAHRKIAASISNDDDE